MNKKNTVELCIAVIFIGRILSCKNFMVPSMILFFMSVFGPSVSSPRITLSTRLLKYVEAFIRYFATRHIYTIVPLYKSFVLIEPAVA